MPEDDIEKLLENLKSQDDEVLVKNGFLTMVNSLPAIPTPPPKKRNHPEQVAAYQREIKAIKKLTEISQQ